MRIIRKVKNLLEVLKSPEYARDSLGFVATMGALHQGHMQLVKQSKAQNEHTLASIFVNPKQFNNTEDLLKYPRTEEEDLELLQKNSVDLVFIPEADDMFPENYSSSTFSFGNLVESMEGEFRPGHFEGVAVVLERFFSIIKPTKAYFGEKDFQQLRVVQELVKQMQISTEVVSVEIARNDKGLALSSRNQRLTQKQKEEALLIYQSLNLARDLFDSENIESINAQITERFQNSNLELEYFMICDIEDLQPTKKVNSQSKYRAFVAAFCGEVRLIDNMALN